MPKLLFSNDDLKPGVGGFTIHGPDFGEMTKRLLWGISWRRTWYSLERGTCYLDYDERKEGGRLAGQGKGTDYRNRQRLVGWWCSAKVKPPETPLHSRVASN